MSLRDRLREKYVRGNRLDTVFLEVTHRCMCDCVHCFLVRDRGEELTLPEIEELLRQLVAEGTLVLGITGGEPFLRADFPRILELVRKDHFVVTVLTTGIPIGPPEAQLLRRLKMRYVEMSLLGACAETHDALMRFPGAFDRLLRAAKLLREADAAVTLKATVMSPNWREVPAMAALAEHLGARFLANACVTPRSDGDGSPLKVALSREELGQADLGLLDGGLIPWEEDAVAGARLTCYAGVTSATISPQGDVFPCILLRHRVGNVRQRTIQDIWHDHPDPMLVRLRQVKPEDVTECYACAHKSVCRRCPGVAYSETGRLGTASPSSCRMARDLAYLRNARGGGGASMAEGES